MKTAQDLRIAQLKEIEHLTARIKRIAHGLGAFDHGSPYEQQMAQGTGLALGVNMLESATDTLLTAERENRWHPDALAAFANVAPVPVVPPSADDLVCAARDEAIALIALRAGLADDAVRKYDQSTLEETLATLVDSMLEDNQPEAAADHAGVYGYFVNLDERGCFNADVRDASGNSLFTVLGGNELGEEETSLVDDGYMRHVNDLDGLREYLVEMKVLPSGAQLLCSADFERLIDDSPHPA